MDFSSDDSVQQLQAGLPDEFFGIFDQGVKAYLSGAWQRARELLQNVLVLKSDDGPTLTLLRYMGHGNAPSSWRGFRELTEK